MREVVLLQKVFSRVSLKEFREFLKELFGGLRVKLTGLSAVENGWIKVTISGEDENVATRFLEQEVGLAPIVIENVEHFSALRGKVIFSEGSRANVFVDVGVFSPAPVYAVVPLQRLQGQLVDGKKFALKQIVDLFEFVDGFPLEVRIIDKGVGEFKAELTERQLGLFSSWINARVDRLIVLGALSKRVKEAVRKARLNRDVVDVEVLGALEHSIVCKLGTDAAGLAPKIGRWLPKTRFVCFSPREVLKSVGRRW